MNKKHLIVIIIIILVVIITTIVICLQPSAVDLIRKEYHAKYPTTSYEMGTRETVPWGIDRKQLQKIMSKTSQNFVSESTETVCYVHSSRTNLTNEFCFTKSGEFYKMIFKKTDTNARDEMFFIDGMYELLGKGFALNLDGWGLDGRERELISGEIKYDFTWVEDDQLKELEYSQTSLLYSILFNEDLDKEHEFNLLASKCRDDRNSIQFLSITAMMTLIDGLFIELSYEYDEITDSSVLTATFTNTILQNG